MSRAVGIDLGTTYTVLAVIEGDQPRVIPNAEGELLTPSVVTFTQDEQPLVGLPAKLQAAAHHQWAVASIKRHMGSGHRVQVGEREHTPEEISGFILRKVKTDAEAYLGESIDKAVITVPAYFNDRQRQATRQAGFLAGLQVLRIINEPTAAALAYGLDREDIHTVLVWDLGGGTFDVSILEIEAGILEVRAVSGDPWLGGDDYDQRLADYLAGLYPEPWGKAFRQDRSLRQRLQEAAEKAKIELSTQPWAQVRLPTALPEREETASFKTTVIREQFQALTRDLLERMIPPTEQALADAELKPGDIHRVLLVGGATRMPAVQELARELLGQEPYRGLNPDEAVALGAALQAGMLLGQMKKTILLDVLPLSLGVETQGGLFARVLRRNIHLPAAESRIFTTAADNQTSMDIHVLQGEQERAQDNLSLGQFQLQDIPPLSKGVPRVEVTFEADVNGILHVSARDLLSESEAKAEMIARPDHYPEKPPLSLATSQGRAFETPRISG